MCTSVRLPAIIFLIRQTHPLCTHTNKFATTNERSWSLLMFLCLLIKIFLKTSIGKTQPNHFTKSGCIKMLLRRAQHKLLQVRENRNPAARDYNKTPPASRDISSIEKSRMFFIILRTMNRQRTATHLRWASSRDSVR